MGFLDEFSKTIEKMDGVATSAKPPAYWFSTGSYALNKIISGSFHKGVPQGRVIGFAGPAGAGKSYLCANAIKNAQKEGAIIIVLDSENALDDDFMSKIGVDVDDSKYFYNGISTINQVIEIISVFLKGYEKEYGKFNPDAPKILFVLDSLDMLLTDSELDNFTKGKQKGDQGQKSKQAKAMLKNCVNGIKAHNISMIVTTQVYKNQDLLNGEGVWMVNNAIRFALSQIVLLTKAKLKEDKSSSEVDGISMKCEGFKTRFTKPHQKVTIKVPYNTGMDPYSDLENIFESTGILKKTGGWYSSEELDIKFQKSNLYKYADQLLQLAEKDDSFIDSTNGVEDDMNDIETVEETKERRKKKVSAKK